MAGTSGAAAGLTRFVFAPHPSIVHQTLILFNSVQVAGATAASGAGLDEVVTAAQRVAGALGTLGVALRVCTLPGKEPSDR